MMVRQHRFSWHFAINPPGLCLLKALFASNTMLTMEAIIESRRYGLLNELARCWCVIDQRPLYNLTGNGWIFFPGGLEGEILQAIGV